MPVQGSSFERFFERILIVLNYVSVLLIFATAIWIFGDVTGRFFFNQPIPGTTELIKTAILAIVFLGVAYTLNRKAHIRTTVLVRRLKPRSAAWLEALGALIGIIIFALTVFYGWEAAVKAWEVQEFEGVQLRIPTYPSRFIMVLGSALLVIQYILHFIDSIRTATGARKGGEA